MKKIYFNLFNNKGIVVDETNKTYSLIKATEIKSKGCFFYPVSLRRILEIKNDLAKRSFTRA